MSTAAMEAFFMATKAQPKSEEELQSVLADLPRRELQALSKTHGVKATLKRESLVEMLVRALKGKLWPEAETTGTEDGAVAAEPAVKGDDANAHAKEDDAAVVVAEGEEEKDEAVTADSKTEETVATTATVEATIVAVATAVDTADTTTEKKTTKKTKATVVKKSATIATVVVGKKAAVQRKPATESPKGKLKRTSPIKVTAKATTKIATPSKTMAKATTPSKPTTKSTTPSKAMAIAKAVTPSKVMDKLHAKQIAKQPTLQEHEQAKKKRAAGLMSGTKVSAVKKTRSKTKELADAAAATAGVTKTLSFNMQTPDKKRGAPISAPAALPSQKETKKPANYKPYVGPLPAFQGDSLFSPKKVDARPAPMAVALMKATRTTTPKKTVAKKTTTATTAAKKTTATTKKTTSATPPRSTTSNKENASPPAPVENENNVATKDNNPVTDAGDAPTKNKTVVAKPRASIKATSTKVVAAKTKKDERRTNFAQDSKTKSAASRRQARGLATTTTQK